MSAFGQKRTFPRISAMFAEDISEFHYQPPDFTLTAPIQAGTNFGVYARRGRTNEKVCTRNCTDGDLAKPSRLLCR